MERLYKLGDRLADKITGIDKLKPDVLNAINVLSKMGLPTTSFLITEAIKGLKPERGNIRNFDVLFALERLEESEIIKHEEFRPSSTSETVDVYKINHANRDNSTKDAMH